MSLPCPPCHNNQALTSLPHPFPPPSPDQINRPLSAGLEIRLSELKPVTARGVDGRLRRGVAGWKEPTLTVFHTLTGCVTCCLLHSPWELGRMERGVSASLAEGWPVMLLNISESASASVKGKRIFFLLRALKAPMTC